MPKKISKIILHAKNRLSGKKTTSSSSPHHQSSSSAAATKSDDKVYLRTTTGSTSDSSRLLQNYDDDFNDDDIGGGQSQASTAIAADYDDFESPDLNLQSLDNKNQQQTSSISGDGDGSGNNSSNNQPNESLQGQPVRILRSLLSFGRNATPASTVSGYNELYTSEQVKDPNQKHWWQSDFLLGSAGQPGPALFGTWNGVFITTVVHLFGVISFLRIGWMVGQEGVPMSMGITFVCLLFNAISLLAAIGIMERCAAATTNGYGPFNRCCPSSAAAGTGGGNNFDPEYPQTTAQARANVHILIATVLGSRIGGAISLVYCIGQAVSCALHVTGFSETFVHLVAVWIERQLPLSNPDFGIGNTRYNNTVSIHSGIISASKQQTSMAITVARLMHIDIVQGSQSTDNRLQLILTPETFQLVSMILILFLLIFNIVGVRWLFRLQTILFLALVAAIGDFTVGIFQQHPDFGYGPLGASRKHFLENMYPYNPDADSAGSSTTITSAASRWSRWHQLFDVVGVFFPATIGVMAGVNMGSDLECPTKSIPCGSFMAILSSYITHVLFILGLALTCSRVALLEDYAIAQHVSAVGVFFLFGLYMSTISSSLGSMYTAPRIMQNLAQELHSVPVVRCFSRGRGPNNIPINALILFTLVTMGFVMIGGINTLAPIVTIPYLLTYAAIEYAYFSMAMTFDIQIQREKRFMQIASQLKQSDSAQSGGDMIGEGAGSVPSNEQQPSIINENVSQKEGDNNNDDKNGQQKSQQPNKLQQDDTVSLTLSLSGSAPLQMAPISPSPSLQQQHLAGYGSIQSITQHIKIKRRQSTQSSDSDGESDSSKLASLKYKVSTKSTKSIVAKRASTTSSTNSASGKKTKTIKQLMAAVSNSEDDDDDEVNHGNADNDDEAFEDDEVMVQEVGDDEINQRTGSGIINTVGSMFRFDDENTSINNNNNEQNKFIEQSERLLMPDPELAEIACKQEVWYLRMMNRWIVLLAAILKIILMFVVAWHYALITLAMYLLFCLIIGRTNPGFYPGVSEFSLCKWIRNSWTKILRFWRPGGYTNVGGNGGQNAQTMVASYSYDRIVMPETVQPDFQCQSDQLTKENTDYVDRPPCHFTTTIEPQLN